MVARARVADVMSANPVTARQDATFKQLVSLMIHHDVTALPVVNELGGLEGLVTESDLLAGRAGGAARPNLRGKVQSRLGRETTTSGAWNPTASHVMSAPVMTTSPTASVDAAARQMIEQRIGRVVVVDDEGRLLGIVSRRDVLRSLDRPDDEIAADVRSTLDDPTLFQHGHRIHVGVKDGCVTLTGTVDYPSNVAGLHDRVMGVAGVVDVDSQVTAELPEPRPEGAALPDPPYELPR